MEKCSLCGGKIVNHRCVDCGMPYPEKPRYILRSESAHTHQVNGEEVLHRVRTAAGKDPVYTCDSADEQDRIDLEGSRPHLHAPARQLNQTRRPARDKRRGGWLVTLIILGLALLPMLFNLADGAYGKAIKGARTELDWLSTNPMVVDAYLADPACGFRFSAGAYIALTGLLVDVSKKSNINRIPKELPLYLIAGSEDPVGDRGRGVTRVFKEYKEAGIKDVDMRLYLGARHEILNEVDKEKVYADVLKWLEAHLA